MNVIIHCHSHHHCHLLLHHFFVILWPNDIHVKDVRSKWRCKFPEIVEHEKVLKPENFGDEYANQWQHGAHTNSKGLRLHRLILLQGTRLRCGQTLYMTKA